MKLYFVNFRRRKKTSSTYEYQVIIAWNFEFGMKNVLCIHPKDFISRQQTRI